MLLTNHALTGVWLGSVIEAPVLALPVGFASHLALDSVPHSHWLPYKFVHQRNRPDPVGLPVLADPRGLIIGALDFTGAVTILVVGLVILPERRAAVSAGWLGAILPDLLYIPELLFKKRLFPAFKAFHNNIQWSESWYGIAVELPYGLLMLHLLHLI